ncbi:MAG TPA: TolC family protein [Gemmatimonadaceae bacterium]|nr:TolC family protein [Gemmatimonadaceae bacterium]
MLAALAALSVVAFPPVSSAQLGEGDSLRLDRLQAAAALRDPRVRQLAIREAQAALRLRTIAAERLPSIAGSAQAQHQSVVTRFPAPQGAPGPTIPHDTYDASVAVTEPLLDPTRSPRATVERAQLARARADVATALHGVRQQVNAGYFAVAALAARHDAVAATIADLEAQARVVESRVRNGTALRGELSAIRAELLRRRQDDAQLLADRDAALRVLSDLTGLSLSPTTPIALPALERQVAEARARHDSVVARPELERFERVRDVLARQSEVVGAQTKPRVSAFARAGVGKPGLDMLSTRPESYWIGGVQVQWNPLDWGRAARERAALSLERDAVEAEAAAFRDALRRSAVTDLATIDRLEQILAADDEIIALREQIDRETAARFRESAITAAEYVDRQTDLLAARIARGLHRVELAQARAAFLTTLGLQVR